MNTTDDLALIRASIPDRQLEHGEEYRTSRDALAALARVQTELSRLTEEWTKASGEWLASERRALAAEAEITRLQNGLREIIDLPVTKDPVHLARALLGPTKDTPGEPCECGRPTSICNYTCDFCTGGVA